MYSHNDKRTPTSKARKVARYLDANVPYGSAVQITDLADVLSAKYGKPARSWYVLVNQLFNDGKPARRYLAEYTKVYSPTGYRAILRQESE